MSSKTGSSEIKQVVEKAEWEVLFEYFDKDKSGEISYVEFITRADDYGELADLEDLQEAMKMFRDGDNGDKKLTKAEFAKMMGEKFVEIKVMSTCIYVRSLVEQGQGHDSLNYEFLRKKIQRLQSKMQPNRITGLNCSIFLTGTKTEALALSSS